MSTESSLPLPATGEEITTACGDTDKFAANTPRALYQEKWVFFCTPLCLQEFTDEPGSSCYASQIDTSIE
jgi:YHS domain-containing protein